MADINEDTEWLEYSGSVEDDPEDLLAQAAEEKFINDLVDGVNAVAAIVEAVSDTNVQDISGGQVSGDF